MFKLFEKLWERLEIEEDEEPMWYLINCVATLEMDLLRQCREVCKDMPEAIKFVVPMETKTRSHGANKMVTERKVKYQGYLFAKLRLCPKVYEAIQGLDLCRSWMGTVNHKGYKKLPPAPLALNEEEIESFGLESLEGEEDELDGEESSDSNVIVDLADEEEVDNKLDKDALKAFKGLKVEDMVKITKKGNFHDEDGVIRRLKDGKILVRFYTYGTMYEEWFNPDDVRKLSSMEILRGLSGPSEPITGRQEDVFSSSFRPRTQRANPSPFGDGPGTRNRRQDRVANQYSGGDRPDLFGRTSDEKRRDERNWNSYQDQQRQGRTQQQRTVASDNDWSIQSGTPQQPERRFRNSRNNRDEDDWALGDVDSQWGRGRPERNQFTSSQGTRQPRQQKERRRNNWQENQRTEAAIEGQGDWSSFVSSSSTGSSLSTSAATSADNADDFFNSLVSDLSVELQSTSSPFSTPSASTRDSSSKPSNYANQESDDDFFASLMSDLQEATNTGDNERLDSVARTTRRTTTGTAAATSKRKQGDDNDESSSWGSSSAGDADDFFAQLAADLNEAPSMQSNDDDFFAGLESDLDSALDGQGLPTTEDAKSTPPPKKKTSRKTSAKDNTAEEAPIRSSMATSASEGLDKRTVPELKEMLRERGLKVTGKKSELIERLSSS